MTATQWLAVAARLYMDFIFYYFGLYANILNVVLLTFVQLRNILSCNQLRKYLFEVKNDITDL